MPIEVVLPKVDMDMEAGVIAAWKVAEGGFVHTGDILFEMETDKAMMEVESPGTGTIRGLAGITGDPIPVGTAVAWIHTEEAEETAEREPAPASAAGLRATPSARRTARLRGIDLAAVNGSGPLGRIGEKDVEAYADARQSTQSPQSVVVPAHAGTQAGAKRLAEVPAQSGASDAAQTGSASSGELVPFTLIRRLVAQRLSESVRNAPHFYLTAHVEMTALLDAIQRLSPAIHDASGVKPGITIMLAHLAGQVLASHPLVNASVEGEALRLHEGVHIGIAMDRDGDLLVPVLRDVQSRPLVELVTEYGRLRQSVRSRTITPSELRGGTFTISNLGMYEVDAFTAIINQPESAILAIGRIVDTPVGRDGQIVLRPMATLSLSSDHRVVDGITAARFMADLRRAIEDPAAML